MRRDSSQSLFITNTRVIETSILDALTKVGQLYILGAGFSKPAGGPLLREMLDKDVELNIEAVGDYWETPEFKALMRLADDLPTEEKNLEGLFTLLRNLQFRDEKAGRYTPSYLSDFLVKYVSELISRRIDDPEEIKVYRKFRRTYLSDEDVGILSFNYDLIVDQLLVNEQGGLDYGFPANDKFRYFGLRNARTGAPLLKLHDSLNWVSCNICRTIWMHQEYAFHKSGNYCLRPRCLGHLKVLIVPPVWNKEPVAKQISILWKQASDLLATVDSVTVIGFSFPQQDQLALDLVRGGLRRNRFAEVKIWNGPNYNYRSLKKRLGIGFSETGARLQEMV